MAPISKLIEDSSNVNGHPWEAFTYGDQETSRSAPGLSVRFFTLE